MFFNLHDSINNVKNLVKNYVFELYSLNIVTLIHEKYKLA